MPDEKKKVFVNLSQREYEDLQSLAVFHSGNDDIRVSWRVSRMIHDFCIERIKRNRRLISRHRLFLHQLDNEHSYRYPKIREAIALIRNIQNNTLKMALSEEEDIIHAKEKEIAN